MNEQYRLDMLNSSKREHVYVHMNTINDSYTDTMPCKFQFSRDGETIIKDPHLYKLGISKMSIDTFNGIPMMIPKVLIGINLKTGNVNTDPNTLCYSITLSYNSGTNNYDSIEYVKFVPQNNASAPSSGSAITQQDNSSSYYYLNDYKSFVDMINTAFETAYNNLNTVLTQDSITLNSYPPFLVLSDNLLIMNADKNKYDNKSTNPYIKIYINSPMFELLNGFKWSNIGLNGANGKNYILDIENDGTNILSLDTYDAITQLQNYSSLELWCPITSIVLVADNLPVYSELIGQPLINQAKSNYNLSNKASLNIIQNLSIDLSSDLFGYMPNVSFSTLNNYRWVDLKHSNEITSIYISVYFRDKYDNLYPLYLPPQGKSYLDIVFTAKHLIIN